MSELEHLELDVQGMTCPSCATHVAHALKSVAGVQDVDVPGWQSGQAAVVADSTVTAEALAAAVRQAGYSATVKTHQPLNVQGSGNGSGSDYDFDCGCG